MKKRSDVTSARNAGDADPAHDPSAIARLVVRSCKVCEWQAEAIERPGEVVDCPWCHGPTELVRVVPPPDEARDEKNPHAAALGRLGGLRGGPARAAMLTPKQRRAIAFKAAKARWSKSKNSKS